MASQRPVPIVGQPFSVQQLGICVNLKLACNCTTPASTVAIVASAPTPCPGLCGKVYNAMIDPTTNRLEVVIATPGPQGEPL